MYKSLARLLTIGANKMVVMEPIIKRAEKTKNDGNNNANVPKNDSRQKRR